MSGIGDTIIKKCTSLTPAEADGLFFPGRGGKSNRAKAFCSDCPFKSQCLKEAIRDGLQGFISGTTEDERKEMAKFLLGLDSIEPITLDDYVPKVSPPVGQHPTGRRIKKKPKFKPYDYLDEVREPTIEELLILDTIID
jgi:hypothetical protein